ncbi:MAG: PcfJ domain-containing protein [Eubacteriales bacterium]
MRQQIPYLPEALQEKALDRLGRYLIYYNIGRNQREAVCTKCGRTMVAEKGDNGRFCDLLKAKHREEGICPCCGEKVIYIAQGRMKNFASLREDRRFVFVWHENHDRIWIMAAHARDEINPGDYRSDLHYAPDRIWLLTSGKVECERVVYAYCNTYWLGYKPRIGSVWSHPSNPHLEPYQSFMGNGGDYTWIDQSGLEEPAFSDTFLRYAEREIRDICGDIDVKMLVFMAEHPKLSEMLLKFGAYWVIRERVYGGKENKSLLNWSADTPYGFFRMDKASFKAFAGCGCGRNALEIYHAGKGVKGFTMETAIRLAKQYKSDGVTLVRAAKWLGVKADTVAEKVKARKYSPVEWADYISMAKKLKYDLKNPVVVYPKDLKEAHDRASAQMAIRVSEAAKKAYKARKVELSHKYCYCDGTFFIRPPFTQEEIIREGKLMHHCVGTYAERHMKGQTDILFMRRCDRPDTPLYTIEIKDGVERQIRGKYNGVVKTAEEKEFHKNWLAWVQGGSRPEDKPNLKSNKQEKTA